MNILRSSAPFSVSLKAALLLLFVTQPLHAGDPPWGTFYTEFIKNRSSSMLTEFKPSEKPGYKHKILTFITGINPDIINRIKVVRIRSNPVNDYLFVNNRLYTIKENWNVISLRDEKKISSNLRRRFGKPDIKDDGNLRITSFRKGRTKVIYYRLLFNNGTARCTTYYYSTRMFRMLFMER